MTFGARFGQLVRRYREAENWTAKQLAEEAFDDEAKRTRISELENGKVAKPHATTIHALSTTLGISDEEIEDCRNRPANSDGQGHVPEENVSLAQDVRQMSRAQLESLGRRFGIDEVDTLSDASLVALLEAKAEDLKRLSAEIESLRGLSDRIDNIIAAARAAAESGDLEEAEQLVASAKESLNEQLFEPLERNWRLATTQADIALIRGDTQKAYDLISAAADAFAAVDPVEPARRRIYEFRLYDHALRYGGDGFLLTIAMQPAALDPISEKSQPGLFGDAQNNLGNALAQQGQRTGGDDGTNLLAEAVTAYRAALRVADEADHPVNWAMTQNNLGNALRSQGSWTGGEEGTQLLAEAVTAYRAALRVYTEADRPVDWAATQNNLGNALQSQGGRTGGEEGADLLAEAFTAYRAALRVYTEANRPVEWAMTQNNPGIALKEQGKRTGCEEGAKLLAEAVNAYRAALRVRTETDHPVDWAATQNNLGIALRHQGSRTGDGEGAGLLAEAVAAHRAGLRINTEADQPVKWALNQEGYALAELAIAEHASCTDTQRHWQNALSHVENALRIYDPEHMAVRHENATRIRDRVAAKLAALDQ